MNNDKITEILKIINEYLENVLFYIESIPDLQDMPLKHYLLIKSLVTEKDSDWDNLVENITNIIDCDN